MIKKERKRRMINEERKKRIVKDGKNPIRIIIIFSLFYSLFLNNIENNSM